MFQNGKSGILP